jgi:hypothetical protein
MAFIHWKVEWLSVDFAARRFQKDWFRFGFLAGFQDVHSSNLIGQPAVERVLLAPGNAGYCCKMDNSIAPVNSFSDRLVVSDVAADLFAVQKPGVRVEFQVKE